MPLTLSAAVLLLAFAFGWSIRRSSICVVRAMQRWIVRGKPDVVLSLASCAAWGTLVLLPLAWWYGAPFSLAPALAVGLPLVAGAALFGIGAAINGGCSFGTVSRIGGGEASILLALPGYAAGVELLRAIGPMRGAGVPSPFGMSGPLGIAVLLAAVALVSRELAAIAGGRYGGNDAAALRRRHVRRWLAVMSVSGALLFGIEHRSVFGDAVIPTVRWALGRGAAPEAAGLLILGAVLAGSVCAAIARGDWRWQRPRLRASTESFAGGAIMGAGTTMIAGGNDFLVLYGIPSGALEALAAIPVMLAATAAALWIGGARPEPGRSRIET